MGNVRGSAQLEVPIKWCACVVNLHTRAHTSYTHSTHTRARSRTRYTQCTRSAHTHIYTRTLSHTHVCLHGGQGGDQGEGQRGSLRGDDEGWG